MKKIKYLIIFVFTFMLAINVNADTKFSARLECNDTAKIGEKVICNIKADIDQGSITSLNATLYVELPDGENYNQVFTEFNENLKEMGSNITIGTIEISKDKITKSGNLSISLQFNSATSVTDVILPSEIINKQIKVLNNNANLDSLIIDDVDIINSLDKEYTYNKEQIEIKTILSDNNASIKSGSGKINLICGKNTYNVITLAEDKTTTKTYKILINRTCDENATLKDIKLSSGSLNPTFNSSVTNYTVSVSKDIDKLSITPSLTSEKSKYTINNSTKNEVELNYGDNEVKIEVISETGTKNTYTLVINREDGRDTNNYLSDIKLSDGKILFDKDTLSYDIRVLYEVTKIDIEAPAEMATSKVEISDSNLEVGTNIITIKVTSEKGEEREYILNIERLKEGETLGDNPKIKDIVISGYNLDFNTDVTSYTLKIKDEEKLDITVYMEDETASYKIENNENLKNKSVITINTLSEDGSTLTYKIFIEKSNSILFIIILIIIVILSFGIVIYFILKNKKQKNKVVPNPIKEDKILSKIDKQLDQINDYNASPVVREAVLEEVEEYKICPLCGHKISFEASICPYCKKNFSKSTETL